MYIPSHFRSNQTNHAAYLQENSFGELLSMVEGRICGSHLPFIYHEENNSLICHVAKANPQWQEIAGQEVLAIFAGAHGYISPSWYETDGVPTWNYQSVHIYGRASCFDDLDDLETTVKELSNINEANLEQPWKPEFDKKRLKGIVGIEIAISDIQAKSKLSQNRSEADKVEIVRQLNSRDNSQLAAAMSALFQGNS
jgi:transcriptional regulator